MFQYSQCNGIIQPIPADIINHNNLSLFIVLWLKFGKHFICSRWLRHHTIQDIKRTRNNRDDISYRLVKRRGIAIADIRSDKLRCLPCSNEKECIDRR